MLFVCSVMPLRVAGRARIGSGANIRLWRAYGRWYEAVESVDIHGDWSAIERRRDEVYGER